MNAEEKLERPSSAASHPVANAAEHNRAPPMNQISVSQQQRSRIVRVNGNALSATNSTAGPSRRIIPLSHASRANVNINRKPEENQKTKMLELEKSQKAAMSNFRRFDCYANGRTFPDVKISQFHTLMFLVPNFRNYTPGDLLHPYPAFFKDVWDEYHVHMPCSDANGRLRKVPVPASASGSSGENQGTSRGRSSPVYRDQLETFWAHIQDTLINTQINSFDDIGKLMRHSYRESGSLNVLRHTLYQIMSVSERENFFKKVLPTMRNLAVQVQEIVTGPIPLLIQEKNQSVSFTQRQIACLLSHAFFSTFPDRIEEERYRKINFKTLLSWDDEENHTTGNGQRDLSRLKPKNLSSRAHKLRCILHYFERVTNKMPSGIVTYMRKSVKQEKDTPSLLPDWKSSKCQLKQMVVRSGGNIEDDGKSMLQVDFANRFIGGGVMENGCFQEEILFVIYPELLLARLFTERLLKFEALRVTGCERFSKYTGYGSKFEFAGNYVDDTPFDYQGRRLTQWVAMDAAKFESEKPITPQYQEEVLLRDLNKAYIAFSYPRDSPVAVATGKWGCGAFKGDPCLKAMIQYLAASENGRDIAFFAFGDTELQENLYKIVQFMRNKTVGDLFRKLEEYRDYLEEEPVDFSQKKSLTAFICDPPDVPEPEPEPDTQGTNPSESPTETEPKPVLLATIDPEQFYGVSSEQQPFEARCNFPKVKPAKCTPKSAPTTEPKPKPKIYRPNPKPKPISEDPVVENDGKWSELLQKLKETKLLRQQSMEGARPISEAAAANDERMNVNGSAVDAAINDSPEDEPKPLTDDELLARMVMVDHETMEYENQGEDTENEESNYSDDNPPPVPRHAPTLPDFYLDKNNKK